MGRTMAKHDAQELGIWWDEDTGIASGVGWDCPLRTIDPLHHKAIVNGYRRERGLAPIADSQAATAEWTEYASAVRAAKGI